MKPTHSLRTLCAILAGLLATGSGRLHATQTENNVLHILPAPGPVKIDGKATDWDLSGGIFACDDVERLRDVFSVWFYAMYDKENLYLLAKWKDQTPLNNPESSKGGHGFQGDCLQVRFATGYNTPDERVTHWTCWRDRDGTSVMDLATARDFKGPGLRNAIDQGAQQAFQVDADGKGYVQEIAIPWKLLTKSGEAPAPGDTVQMAIEPNFTAGPPWGRLNIHDIFREGMVLDRVFTFRAYPQWGTGVLEKKGNIAPAPVRLSDERLFPVTLGDEWLEADWTGLVQKHELPGFKTITFDAPGDGFISLNIKNAQGEVVRQLLTENFYEKGSHDVKWDGLTSPHYKTPGVPVDAGTYTWEAVTHPAFHLALRGWADNGGNAPWENGPKSHWGGDHGVPDAVAVDDHQVYLGWSEAEAGKGIIACDLDGNVVWKVGSGLGNSSTDLATDGGILYSLGRVDEFPRGEIIRMRTTDGVFDAWADHPAAMLDIPELWAGQAGMPANADGMDVKNGKMYLSFSSETFSTPDIVDWKGFITKVTSDDPLAHRILSQIDQRTSRQMKEVLAGKKSEKEIFVQNPRFDHEAVKALNGLLVDGDLTPNTVAKTSAERAEANRKFVEAFFGPSITPLKTNFIAVCDGHSGKVLKTFPAKYPGAVHALDATHVGYVSEGSAIVLLNVESGKEKTLFRVSDATNFATDPQGKFYVTTGGKEQQVQVFTADGKPSATIGKTGGRALFGRWEADGMYAPSAVAVDEKNKRIWVTEADFSPKRVSVWDAKDGKLVKDFFGATHYGASGGAIDPLDPNVMVGIGCEWRIDPQTGRAKCTGVFDRGGSSPIGFAVFCPGSNGRLYLATNTGQYNAGRVRIFERVAEGDYKLRAEFTPDYATQTTKVWSDENGDSVEQPNEVTTIPFPLHMNGSNGWSLNINSSDMTLFAGVGSPETAKNLSAQAQKISPQDVTVKQTVFNTVYRINPAGFTACGAPKWDLKGMQELPYVWSTGLAAGGFGMLPSRDNRLLVTCESQDFRCYDLSTQKLIWSYPNPFYQVHGSHQAPPPVPGVTRGAYGLIGNFKTPETGTVWAINGNCGEWYLLNEKGYFLGHIFEGDPLKMHFPDAAVPGADMTETPPGSGGEDFGGSVMQAPDGQVYVEAGKTAYWNLLATGFDKVVAAGSGQLEIKPEEVKLARSQRDAQLQAASGAKVMAVKHLAPEFTGNLLKDFQGAEPVTFQKSADTVVRAAASWDGKALYLGWDVAENRPWVNGATDPVQMYLSGDTVDFQFASDPKADPKRSAGADGDFRLSIGNFQGKPEAVLYRTVSSVKKPRAFTSGVVAHYVMDYVDVVPEANVQVTLKPGKNGYVVEAAIPFSALGFVPEEDIKYRGDFGVTYSDEGGSRTRLRNYWSNQETGLVDDAVFELMMTPRNWGDITFQK